LRYGEIRKIYTHRNLGEVIMGAAVENVTGLWINMTGECSSASLAGSRLAVYQLSTLSAGNGMILTWIRKFEIND
jgi:hypothetical protein